MLTPKLFEPIEIAGLHVKNRITMPPMHTNLGNMEIGITDEGIDFYVARARGGFGLIGIGIIDAYYVANAGSPLEYFLQNERQVKQYAGLVKQLKKYDCLPYAQIGVRRLFPVKQLHRKDRPTLAHFAVEIIEEMIEAVVLTAVRAAEAGFEAVDILGVGGSAHSIFLSQVFNNRTDQWGGSPEGRLRFALETVGGIKKALGNDFPIFYRLHGSEFLEGGYGLETAIQNARALEAAGVAYFNVTGGGHATSVPQLTPNVPRDAYAFLACEIKKSVNVPVAASNRNNDPFSVEALLRTGWADLVSLGRQALADADWPNKVRAGDYGAIRRCIACNECLDITVIFDRPVHCLVNPRQGLISEVQPVPAAETPKKVVVVGGGISGLQAALTSAERGHRVILVEKTSSLGGMWNHASYPPGREELFSFLQWLVHQAKRAGVEFRLDTEASEKSLAALQPDVIVVSTGVEAAPIEIPHAEGTPL
ncbi:MAG: FAD-dependent oxidoreductase, partial [bacterium]